MLTPEGLISFKHHAHSLPNNKKKDNLFFLKATEFTNSVLKIFFLEDL